MLYLSSDVGGTFTDLVLLDSDSGRMVVDKIPSSGRQADATVNGLQRIVAVMGRTSADLASFIHGSTIATNAWLTRLGADTMLITTDGFRDVLEIGNQRRERIYSLTAVPVEPIVPRSRVLEVVERIDPFGDVVTPLTTEETERVIAQLARAEPQSVAISLLFSWANDSHEQRLAAAIRAALPDIYVYLSSEINPQVDEYLRTNTVTASAYVGPELDAYITSMANRLRDIGFNAPLMLMRSDGGVATVDAVRQNPATMLLSGPAGGVIASAELGRATGIDHIVTFDMGGTSADFSLIAGGSPRISTERAIGAQTLRIPMLDIETISSGGGSIAHVDHAGALHVGPHSAGAVPGPVCYGKGGVKPTLTDAIALLGILSADDFSAGDIQLDVAAVQAAIDEQVAQPLGISAEEAAFGMIAVASAQMRQAIRALTIERGHDLKQFSLLAFGGAGAIFASLMEPELDVKEILIPLRPGVFSALGLLMADIRHNAQAPFSMPLDDLDVATLRQALSALRARVDAALERDGVAVTRRSFVLSADLRYRGQFHDMTVPFDGVLEPDWSATTAATLFHQMHERAYGHSDTGSAVELVNVRVEALGLVDKPAFLPLPARVRGALLPYTSRQAVLTRGGSRLDVPVFRRDDFIAGDCLRGPAVITQSDTTILILPTQQGKVDAFGVIHISTMGKAA